MCLLIQAREIVGFHMADQENKSGNKKINHRRIRAWADWHGEHGWPSTE